MVFGWVREVSLGVNVGRLRSIGVDWGRLGSMGVDGGQWGSMGGRLWSMRVD